MDWKTLHNQFFERLSQTDQDLFSISYHEKIHQYDKLRIAIGIGLVINLVLFTFYVIIGIYHIFMITAFLTISILLIYLFYLTSPKAPYPILWYNFLKSKILNSPNYSIVDDDFKEIFLDIPTGRRKFFQNPEHFIQKYLN